MKINLFCLSEMGADTRQRLLNRAETDIQAVMEPVALIVDDVRRRGDAAIKELNARFDGAPDTMKLLVPEEHYSSAEENLSQKVKDAIEYSVENVRRFHKDQCPNGMVWKEIRSGILAGERTLPIDSVGLYVPRARGSFPSMLYMMAVPAKIAGVKEISVASPPDADGRVDPACLYTARLCGVDRVLALGGAQAWAAFAWGTESVPRVDKCLGPGSKYVAAAKRLLADCLDCGLPAGPSESIIIADAAADSLNIARNLLVEAEHGLDSAALLITDSPELAERVRKQASKLGDLLPEPRRSFVSGVLSGYGGIILVDSIDEAVDLANEFATEHLMLQTADPFAVLGRVTHAGEIILGAHCPFSAANYSVGANAVLPTGGRARTWSGISVADFKKKSSVIYVAKEGFDSLRSHAAALAEYEEFQHTGRPWRISPYFSPK